MASNSSLQIYKFDNFAVIGFYLNSLASSGGFNLEVDLSSDFGQTLRKHIKEYDSATAAKLIERVDLGRDINSQFDRQHLPCQLVDAAKQVINLNEDEVAKFSEELKAALHDENEHLVASRKMSVIKVLSMILSKLEE